MKKIISLLLLLLALLFVLPAERIVLHLVANVPVKTYFNEDTFTVDNDEEVDVEVFGAKLISEKLYKITDDEVTLKLTKNN